MSGITFSGPKILSDTTFQSGLTSVSFLATTVSVVVTFSATFSATTVSVLATLAAFLAFFCFIQSDYEGISLFKS